ncbi:unnamed protein product [Protopolystoma xenopodis]|uniref:Uncharacterized protein n=1 Tax=Protopolystoma xenopodis TaxID=117903 RepID=A0A3S5FH68_9PLAT|nr:unnamed protein product [Protopolystoma xenopodis]
MLSCFDDVRHMTDESTAKIQRGRRAVRRGPIRTNLHSHLQGNFPSSLRKNKLMNAVYSALQTKLKVFQHESSQGFFGTKFFYIPT